MKKLFLSVVLLLAVSFAFGANDVENVSIFDVEKTTTFDVSKTIQLDNVDKKGHCWVNVRVTATNTETGESYTYTYWAYVGMTTDLEDCEKESAAYVSAL